jgi:hypothetical protein
MADRERAALRLVANNSSIPQCELSNREICATQLSFPNDGSIELIDDYEASHLAGLMPSNRALYRDLRKLWGAGVFKITREHFFNMKSRAKNGHAPLSHDLDEFFQFARAVGPRPSLGHSIDRIDNNAGYSSKNIRWATATEQALNRSSTLRFHLNGLEGSKTLLEAASLSGNTPRKIRERRSAGLSDDEAVFGRRRGTEWNAHRAASVKFTSAEAFNWSSKEVQTALYAARSRGLDEQRLAINEALRRLYAAQEKVDHAYVPEERCPTDDDISRMGAVDAEIDFWKQLLLNTYPLALRFAIRSSATGFI